MWKVALLFITQQGYYGSKIVEWILYTVVNIKPVFQSVLTPCCDSLNLFTCKEVQADRYPVTCICYMRLKDVYKCYGVPLSPFLLQMRHRLFLVYASATLQKLA